MRDQEVYLLQHGLFYRSLSDVAALLNFCGRYRVADIDLWPISTLPVADMVFYVAGISVILHEEVC